MTEPMHTRYINILKTLALVLPLQVAANNIQVTNPALTGNSTSTGTCFVQFDISWENSWRLNGVINWDAAWVFVKYKNPQGLWQHARLDATGHVLPANAMVENGLLTPGAAYDPVSNPVVGFFLRRSADGSGTFTATGVQLRWNYFAQGIAFNDISEVRVFAVEMVHVPQGAFAAGSGGTEVGAFTLTTINASNAVFGPSNPGNLGGLAGGYPTGQTVPASAIWPNGFNAFYCMKYEISQQQYVDFLNTLTRAQQNARTLTDLSNFAVSNRYVMTNSTGVVNRNSIRCNSIIGGPPVPVNFYCDLNGNGLPEDANDGRDIACNFLAWSDHAAYLDWSGLRPMTELEFEKACRGTVLPVANEYPWGTTSVASGPYSLTNAGASNETISTGFNATSGNALYDGTSGSVNGPVRVGVFAANAGNTGRTTSGASYYGIMELAGNLYERTVTIGNATGRGFTGLHGNGALSAAGSADVMAWPATGALGIGYRGGYVQGFASLMQTSERSFASTGDEAGFNGTGGRGVRTAP